MTSENPIIVVKIPKAKDQPQFGRVFLLAIEKKTSDNPLNKKDKAKNIESANKELRGDVETAILRITNRIPTIKGMYQFLT